MFRRYQRALIAMIALLAIGNSSIAAPSGWEEDRESGGAGVPGASAAVPARPMSYGAEQFDKAAQGLNILDALALLELNVFDEVRPGDSTMMRVKRLFGEAGHPELPAEHENVLDSLKVLTRMTTPADALVSFAVSQSAVGKEWWRKVPDDFWLGTLPEQITAVELMVDGQTWTNLSLPTRIEGMERVLLGSTTATSDKSEVGPRVNRLFSMLKPEETHKLSAAKRSGPRGNGVGDTGAGVAGAAGGVGSTQVGDSESPDAESGAGASATIAGQSGTGSTKGQVGSTLSKGVGKLKRMSGAAFDSTQKGLSNPTLWMMLLGAGALTGMYFLNRPGAPSNDDGWEKQYGHACSGAMNCPFCKNCAYCHYCNATSGACGVRLSRMR